MELYDTSILIVFLKLKLFQLIFSHLLRPIRFAFLVHPDNQEQVLEVFRINTCLWGGKFNPIIPIRRNKKGYLSEKEKQVANRYLKV